MSSDQLTAAVLELLDPKTLNRLDLPKTSQSPQGITGMLFQKVLLPVYVTNLLELVPHKTDIKAATAVTLNGQLFQAPSNTRRQFFSAEITYTATPTVGTRSVAIDKIDKANNILYRFLLDAPTASQARGYQIVLGTSSGFSNISVQLSTALVLEQEWSIRVDDVANIDNADTVAWNIEYLENPT